MAESVFEAVKGLFNEIVPVCMVIIGHFHPFLKVDRLAIGFVVLPTKDSRVR